MPQRPVQYLKFILVLITWTTISCRTEAVNVCKNNGYTHLQIYTGGKIISSVQ